MNALNFFKNKTYKLECKRMNAKYLIHFKLNLKTLNHEFKSRKNILYIVVIITFLSCDMLIYNYDIILSYPGLKSR